VRNAGAGRPGDDVTGADRNLLVAEEQRPAALEDQKPSVEPSMLST
jgi:hypothetical protein